MVNAGWATATQMNEAANKGGAAGIAVAIIVAVNATGTAVKGTFNIVANALQ